MLSLAAAVSAPLRTRSANATPGPQCAIIATTLRGVSAVPALRPLVLALGLPPVLEHAISDVKSSREAASVSMQRPMFRSFMSIVSFRCDYVVGVIARPEAGRDW